MSLAGGQRPPENMHFFPAAVSRRLLIMTFAIFDAL
jgi:hypothetical protein